MKLANILAVEFFLAAILELDKYMSHRRFPILKIGNQMQVEFIVQVNFKEIPRKYSNIVHLIGCK